MTPKIRWFSAVLSAPRNPPTLPATLDSLARAGFTSPLVFCDWERCGPMQNFIRALDASIRLAEIRGDEFLLISEDDVEFTAGLRYHIPLPPLTFNSVLSLYCSVGMAEYLENLQESRHGWHSITPPVNARGQGALVYAMHINVARRIRWNPFPWSNCIGADHWVPVVCQKAEIPLLIHTPSLARHTGFHSSLRRPVGDDRFRQCLSFLTRFDEHGEIPLSAVVRGDGSVSSVAIPSSNPGFPARSVC